MCGVLLRNAATRRSSATNVFPERMLRLWARLHRPRPAAYRPRFSKIEGIMVVSWSANNPLFPAQVTALQVLALTRCRKSEIVRLEWCEVKGNGIL